MHYKITNIEYGVGPWGTEYVYGLVGNPKEGESEATVHSVTLIQGGGKNILVDTGVDTENPVKGELWGNLLDECKGIVWALAQVGLTPEDIDTVILTHAHIDHMGGVERFKHARIFLQQDEFEAWERMAADPRYLQATLIAAFPDDYPPARQMVNDGIITLLNGDVINLFPGIDLHVVRNCHSVADQVVVVRSESEGSEEEKTYIIGGDIAMRPANLTGMGDWSGYLVPLLGRTGAAYNLYEVYQWVLEQIEDDMTRLVLTHDTTMTERFESPETEGSLHIHYVCK